MSQFSAQTMIRKRDSVHFMTEGVVWIHPCGQVAYQFPGNVADFMAVMVSHPELDIDNAVFYVHTPRIWIEPDSPYFCGFCRGFCTGQHYISPSTDGY